MYPMEMVRSWIITAFICSVIFALGNSSEVSPLVVVERQGNASFECIPSGRCLSCSLAEKQSEEIYHCSVTGYYMSYKCVEVDDASESGTAEKPTFKGSIQKVSQVGRKQLAEERKIFHINRSCVPSVPEERLTVLGFEGIMLALLAIFSPLLYYRKKRNFVPSGMTRIPTSVRL